MTRIEILKKTKASVMALGVLLLSLPGFSQDPGGSPDGPPPAVPFDDYMHLILLGIGAVFALVVLKKLRTKTA